MLRILTCRVNRVPLSLCHWEVVKFRFGSARPVRVDHFGEKAIWTQSKLLHLNKMGLDQIQVKFESIRMNSVKIRISSFFCLFWFFLLIIFVSRRFFWCNYFSPFYWFPITNKNYYYQINWIKIKINFIITFTLHKFSHLSLLHPLTKLQKFSLNIHQDIKLQMFSFQHSSLHPPSRKINILLTESHKVQT